jgi:hypothetical protein
MPKRARLMGITSLLAAATLAAGCGFFTNPGPTASGPASGSLPAPTPTPTPTPEPRPVASIVLVGAIGEDVDGTPTSTAWQGIQDAGKQLGAVTSRVTPLS